MRSARERFNQWLWYSAGSIEINPPWMTDTGRGFEHALEHTYNGSQIHSFGNKKIILDHFAISNIWKKTSRVEHIGSSSIQWSEIVVTFGRQSNANITYWLQLTIHGVYGLWMGALLLARLEAQTSSFLSYVTSQEYSSMTIDICKCSGKDVSVNLARWHKYRQAKSKFNK